jgi:predicted ribonuclease YlaK
LSTSPRTKKGKKHSEESEAPSRKHRLSLLLKGLRKVSPRTPNQHVFMEHLRDERKTIVIGGGIAGSGKTLMSVYVALELLADPLTQYDQLYIFKSVVGLEGEDMGHLPGDKNDKMFFILQSFFMQMEKILPPGRMEELIKDDGGCIRIFPLGSIRGMSIPSNAIVIVDEIQNVLPSNTNTIVTRFEEGAKLICLGDEVQHDRPKKKDNGLTYLLNEISGLSPEIATVRFTDADCTRKKLIRLLVKAYENYVERTENPSIKQKLFG